MGLLGDHKPDLTFKLLEAEIVVDRLRKLPLVHSGASERRLDKVLIVLTAGLIVLYVDHERRQLKSSFLYLFLGRLRKSRGIVVPRYDL